jgi:hypothetical protein
LAAIYDCSTHQDREMKMSRRRILASPNHQEATGGTSGAYRLGEGVQEKSLHDTTTLGNEGVMRYRRGCDRRSSSSCMRGGSECRKGTRTCVTKRKLLHVLAHQEREGTARKPPPKDNFSAREQGKRLLPLPCSEGRHVPMLSPLVEASLKMMTVRAS